MSCGLAGKESTCSAGDLGLISRLGRSPGEGKSYPLQSSGLENPMDCIVHGVAKSESRLSALHTSLWSVVQCTLELERGESSRARGRTRCYQGRLSKVLFSMFFLFQFY